MKLFKIYNAYNATDLLSNQNLSIQAKWILYQVRKDLVSHYEFYNEELGKLIEQYKPEFITNTQLKFDDNEKAIEFKQKQTELENLEIELMPAKKQLKLSEVPDITVSQIEQLDEFIEFIPE